MAQAAARIFDLPHAPVFAAHADEALAHLRHLDPDVVAVAVGGDGTVNMVARAIRAEEGRKRPMAVLPGGTGNAFAFELGAGKWAAAIETLRYGVPRKIDVLITSDPAAPLALVSISMGFEGQFLARLAGIRAKRGRCLAAPIALAAFARRTSGAFLSCDGRILIDRRKRFYSAGLYNTRRYFWGRIMVPESSMHDGEAHARVYGGRRTYWRALFRSGRSGAGLDRLESVEAVAFRHARIETDGPVQIDGEAVKGRAFDVTIDPSSLVVITRSSSLTTQP